MTLHSAQKITPSLWFDNQAEEAINFYTKLFKNSKINNIQYYPENAQDEHLKGMNGKVLNASFEINGLNFICLDGGPIFKPNPSISFMIACDSTDEVDSLYNQLVDGGTALMELGEYPFSPRYAWVSDKYGFSWQLSVSDSKQKVLPSFLFVGPQHGKAQEAMDLYTKIFSDNNPEAESKIIFSMPYEEGEDKPGIKHAQFTLSGQTFVAMDSGFDHKFNFNEAISLTITCRDQAEVDYFWEKLTADGGVESQCGWLKDKFGVSWQIVPTALESLMSGSDQKRSLQAMEALMKMKKIEISKLEEAYNG